MSPLAGIKPNPKILLFIRKILQENIMYKAMLNH